MVNETFKSTDRTAMSMKLNEESVFLFVDTSTRRKNREHAICSVRGLFFPRLRRLRTDMLLRANAHARSGNRELALADYDRAVTTNGTVFWIHAQRGDAYFLAGDFEEALASYNAALASNPDSAAVLCNRALVYAAAPNEELRNTEQALADAQRANELLPGQPAYIDCLAIVYAANGDFDRAVAEAQRAIDLLPPGNQAILDDFRSRLDLFEGGTAFRIAAS